MEHVAALLSALAWAGLDATRKHLALHIAPRALAVALLLGQAPLFAIAAIVDGGAPEWPRYLVPALLITTANAVASVLFLESVRRAPLSLTIPLLSLTPALSAVIAGVLLREIPSVRDTLGIAAVVTGALVVSTGTSAGAVVDRRRGLWMMAGVAALWSLATPLDKVALAAAPLPFHAAFQTIVGAALLAAIWLPRGVAGEIKRIAQRPGAYLLALALLAAAITLQLVALREDVPVAAIETLKRAIGMALALVFGRLLFAERPSWRALGGVALMTLGVALLLL